MFIAHKFDITDKLLLGKENTLTVHISSVAITLDNGERELLNLDSEWGIPKLLVHLRKAPHMSGWDIMPRAISAGIWRDVELSIEKKYGFKYVHIEPDRKNGDSVKCRITYETHLPI